MDDALLGVFVGGQARRMGGIPKGLLPVDRRAGETRSVIETLIDRFLAAGGTEVVLVGQNLAYAKLEVPRLADDPPHKGPLGGLRALLRHAAGGHRFAISVACDMPYLTVSLFRKLLTADPQITCLAPLRDERWEPMFARFDVKHCLPALEEQLANQRYALQGLLRRLDCQRLSLDVTELAQLADWDTPLDVLQAPDKRGSHEGNLVPGQLDSMEPPPRGES